MVRGMGLTEGQWAVGSGQWAVGSGQWAAGSGQRAVGSGQRAVGFGQWAGGDRLMCCWCAEGPGLGRPGIALLPVNSVLTRTLTT
jgi:hypothetical protein